MNKYRNVKTVVDGVSFSSKKEAAFYGMLKMRVRAKEVYDFLMQVKYPLKANGILICTYIADFVTYNEDGSTIEVIDVKGIKTPVYQIKKKS